MHQCRKHHLSRIIKLIDAACIEQEPTNSVGESTDKANEEDGEDLKSVKITQGESETLSSNEATTELSKPTEEIDNRSAENIDSASANLTEYEVSIDQSKLEEKHSTSEVPGLSVNEEVVS